MDTWVEEIEGWETRPVSTGYAGLRDLADDGFSGAVSAGDAWLCMVSGRVVGVFEYRRTATEDSVEPVDVDRFEGADLTAHAAPVPSVPLLVAMKARGGDSRGKYYTEETPLAEVQDTLESGGFTGYVELSENVLSGDYYTVYQAGSPADLAFVGNARRRFTGEDAADRARDEVGIYEVVAVDLDVTEVPEQSGDSAGAGGAAGAAGATGAVGATGADVEDSDDAESDAGGAGAGAGGVGAAGAGTTAAGDANGDDADDDADAASAAASPADSGGDEDAIPGETDTGPGDAGRETPAERTDHGSEVEPVDGVEPKDEASTDAEAETDTRTETDTRAGTDTRAETDPGAETDTAADADAGAEPVGGTETADVGAGDERTSSAGTGAAAAASSEDADAPEGRPIPSVDPERSGVGGAAGAEEPEPDSGDAGRQRAASSTASGAEDADPDELETLRNELAEREEELAGAREQLESVSRERDDLKEEVERLRGEVNRLSAELGEDLDGPTLTRPEAFAGTNLFVRYRSKGATTLSDLHDGDGGLEELHENLQIEHHTTFPEEGATVDGRPFADWLRDTQDYRFVAWLVGDLLAEIHDSGAAAGMQDLYDALPALDRIEFSGAVTVEGGADEESREVAFDVVCRDRMGDPLVVVNTDESREPVREGAMADLVTDTSEVAAEAETLAGACFVTSSFFEADALETAREATSGSLLSRDRRRSFVKLSRKSGYHLCLVEARDGSFYLSVPDL